MSRAKSKVNVRWSDATAHGYPAHLRLARMILDCKPELAEAPAQRLAEAAANGFMRFALLRQDAAMMMCFTPSVMRSDHAHFIDGARGGYASCSYRTEGGGVG